MNKLPPRVKKPFKSTYDQLIEKKGLISEKRIKQKNCSASGCMKKKYSISFIDDISGRSEEEILEDIKK